MRFIPFGPAPRPAATFSPSWPAGAVPTRLLLAGLLVVGAAACAATDDAAAVRADDQITAGAPDRDTPDGNETDQRADDQPDGSSTGAAAPGSEFGSPLAGQVTELPPAPIGAPPPPEATMAPRPTALTIGALGVRQATVIDVGVQDDGAMEIPPVDEVGWYRYGAAPGGEGSAILAAHIAYDGEDGVFVDLVELGPGAEVEVALDDGTTSRYVVESTARYPKDALPEEVVFARTGPPRLVLVTCGGRFDPEARSYDDNVVVTAIPLADD